MPSLLVGAQSGGVPMVSGNPFSGRITQPGGALLRVAKSVSGLVYVGYSGGVTITSGGALSSGGLLDGIELANGEERNIYSPPGGLANIFLTTPAATSGTLRVFWDPYRK